MLTVDAPRELLQPLNVPYKTMTGPGPSNMSPRVQSAASLTPLGNFQMHPEFMKIFDDIRVGTQYAFQTKNQITLCVPGCAHGAAEATCFNLLHTGDSVLVACNGLWGERFAEIASRQDAKVVKLEKPQGQVFTLTEFEQKLKDVRPVLTFVTYGESTGGTLQPLKGIGALCHSYGSLLVVDGVAAVCAVPMFMDEWEIDVLYVGSQKALSTIPGLTPISFSDRAWKVILGRKTKPRSFLYDIKELAVIWGCLPNETRGYHHTPASANIYTLREALAMLVEEGLEKSWERHRISQTQLHEGIEKLGLEFLVKEPELRLPSVTTVRVPADINWRTVSDFAMSRYKVEIAGGLGKIGLTGSIWRIGIMGHNARPETVQFVLKALAEGLQHAREQQPTHKL